MKDLPSIQELERGLAAAVTLGMPLDPAVAAEAREARREMEELTATVDAFYARLGPRNWVFHDLFNPAMIRTLLDETVDDEAAEARLIELYCDRETLNWWTNTLRRHEALKARFGQIERARKHYADGVFDSCTLHLIAVMDGFVNDFQPAERKGLHAREPDEMAAWDSVVCHHQGLTHVMATFKASKKKRVDTEVREVFRHGIVHGMVVNFNNVVVATKAWNLLFAVADRATATQNAAQPPDPEPTWDQIQSQLRNLAHQRQYEAQFEPSHLAAGDPDIETDAAAQRASAFLDAWQRQRWGLIPHFMPPATVGTGTRTADIQHVKDCLEPLELTAWHLESVAFEQAHACRVTATATINGSEQRLQFRLGSFDADSGDFAVPGEPGSVWRLLIWAPRTYLLPKEAGV
ncbi:hypothetical protein GCM10027447_36220 [Glycomyces halotolerans]